MNLREMMDAYSEEGLTRDLAVARVCQDIDLDFIHYSLDDSSIRSFVQKLNCMRVCLRIL